VNFVEAQRTSLLPPRRKQRPKKSFTTVTTGRPNSPVGGVGVAERREERLSGLLTTAEIFVGGEALKPIMMSTSLKPGYW
jgi:hypothetical protein